MLNILLFTSAIDVWRASSSDILLSFNVASLFTRVPLDATLELLRPLFDPAVVVELFQPALQSRHFIYNDYYEQMDGVARRVPSCLRALPIFLHGAF